MNQFNRAQVSVVARHALRHFGDMKLGVHFGKLADESPATFAVLADLLERTLEGATTKAKEALVADFVDSNGKPYGVSLAKVEEAMAKGKVPPTFLFRDRRLVRVAPFAALEECDLLGRFRADMEKASKVADSAPEAAGEKKTGTDA